MPSKPHTQLGQKGKGKGKKKKARRNADQRNAPAYQTSMPKTNPPEFMPFPKIPDQGPPNFLPNTPGFERDQGQINDANMAAATQYSVGNQMVGPGLGLAASRLNTDMGYARQALDESLAERGVFQSGIRPYMHTQNIAIPFGRQFQDLGLNAGAQYADLASQYGGSLLGSQQALYEAYLNRANQAYEAMPLGAPQTGYNMPSLPPFTPIYGKKKPPEGGF